MLNEVLILLFFSVLGVAIFQRLNFPSVLGYLVVGMLAGQHAFGLIEHSHAIEQIAEIGVVFLLFMIGLEVSIPRLISMRRIVFGIGSIQVLVSTLSTIAIGMWLGLSWQAAFAVGGALTMSSTAIAVKQLTEQRELHSRHGNISLGVLLFQDLAVVPFLVLIPIFASPEAGSTLMPVLYALAKGTFAFTVIYFAGQYMLRPAIRAVASTHSSELFTLFILLVALLAAGLTWKLGLSLAMGAFLAGIMLAETEFKHHVEMEIRPFRDVLMGLFFITVGSQFDWAIIISEPLAVVILTLGLIFGKGIAIMVITHWAGFEKGVAIRAGVVLGQGSEFGFALLALALSTGLLEIELSQPIIAAIIISMALSPMLIRHNEAIANRLAPDYVSHHQRAELDIEHASDNLSNHVILCGFGRTGQNLALFLKRVNIPFIALEVNTELIQEAWEAGDPVYYGDSSRTETLVRAGIHTAKALVISFPQLNASEHITRSVKHLRPDLPLIVRTRDDRNLEQLLEYGADEVIPDTLESSMMLAKHTLGILGLDQITIDEMLTDAREDHYARIRAFFHTSDDVAADSLDPHHLHSIEVLADSYVNGKTIDSLKCLPKINIVALRRNGVRSESPLLDTPLKSGDVLVVKGRPDDIRCAEIEVMSGM
ncbi:MAG: CPA2 family monovalent cation:H+ antiporter-2 [Gammaproteobacteria bacterium]|jgi:CPA2 family monovalent cation:H+ antiporter-2